MEISAADLTRILDLYGQGLYVQAYHQAVALAPLKEWTNTAGRIVGGRISRQLGAPRLSRWLLLKAYRQQPTHPEAAYYHARYFLEQQGPYAAWRFMQRWGNPSDAPPDITADWFALRAFLTARMRDFQQAERWIAKALEVAPNRPWVLVEQSSCLEFAERNEDALAVARKALDIKPWFRPAVQSYSHLLTQLNRSDEALQFLLDAEPRLECASVSAQLAGLQDELRDHAGAKRSYERFAELSPLIEDEVKEWLNARRSDVAYDLGNYDDCLNLARQAGDGFHKTLVGKLESPPPEAKRVLLPVEPPRPIPANTPAALATMRHFWQPNAAMPSDDLFKIDAPGEYLERAWVGEGAWVVREFTVTEPAAHALIDQGVPFALCTVEATYAHLQPVVGYDQRRGVLLLREPTERHEGEMLLQPLLERFRSSGPRGLLAVPPDQAGRINGVALPDSSLYDQLFALHQAIVEHRRESAVRIYDTMRAEAPDHRLTLQARVSIARYDGNNAELLAAVDALLALFPNDPTLLLQRISVLRDLDRRDERVTLLARLSGQKEMDPIFTQQYGQELITDTREHDRAEKLLRKAIKLRSLTAAPYFYLANLLWDDQRTDEALELYRFAACLDDASDPLARTYFRSARSSNRTDEALSFLRDRFQRLGDKSGQPAKILFNALSDLEQTEDAFAVLDRALAKRKTDGDLLLFASEMRASFGSIKEAAALLKAAQDKVKRPAWLRAAANLAGLQGNLPESLTHWQEVIETEPLALDAHRAIALRLAELKSRPAALEHLKQFCTRFPYHYGLLQLWIEWLRGEGPAAVEPVVRQLIANHPADAWARRELALHLADQKRFADADAALDDAARLEPPSPSYHCVCGRVHTLAGRPDQARESYRAAIRLSVDNELAVAELLALCNSRQERRDELLFVQDELNRQPHTGDGVLAFHNHAAHTLEDHEIHAALQRLLDDRGDLWQTWSAMTQQLLSMERFPEARTLAEQATERFPLLPRLWIDRAQVCAATGDTDGQRDALRQALKISPGWGVAARELSEVLDRDGQLEESRDLLEQAVARAPLDPGNHAYLAEKLWKLGDSKRAVEQLQEALRLDPGYDWAWRTLHEWADRMERPDLPIELSRDLTQRRPGDARVWLALVRNLGGPENTNEVLAALDKVLELSPRNSEARDLKSERLAELGRFDEAAAACRRVEGEDAQPLILQGRQAWVEARRGNREEAIHLMEGIVQEEPDYYWGWQQLAEWYSEAGRSEDYLRAANEMVRLRPESPYSLARRGEALILTGERESGKADLRQAQKLAPDYPLPGMLLFDEQLADEEFEQAADTLAILQEHVGDDFVSARQCQLACRQNDRDAALDAFRYLCESPVEATWPITTAFGAVRAAGWGDEAETILRESLESRLFNPHLAILWLDTPSADEAPEEERLNVLDRAISRHPRYLPLYDRKAELLSRMDRYDEAAATCRPAGFDDLPLILRGRAAWVEFQRGNRDRGIELMRECVANAPDYYWGWQQLANWFETTEQFSGYLESAEQMVRLAPRDPTAFGYRGEARLRTGDREGAKADFRRAYEMDPEYGFAGLHLLDEQLNDNEIEDAAETLARLRERGDDAYIRLRALRLAIAQQDQDEALRMLEEYVGDDDTPPPMFARALELLDEAGWQADVDRVLAARLDDDDAAEPAARAWVERKLAQGLPDEILPRVTRWLERDDDVGREALLAYLEGIARNRDKPRLFECIDRFTEAFREETLSWGKVGWALTRVHEYTRAADWMHDWPEREDPGSWMLINLAICLRAIDRDTEAAAVSLHARQNADPDFTSPFHDIWLALDEALAGHTAAAAEAIDPVVARRGDLDDYFRMVLAMVEGLLMVQQAPRGQKSGAFAIARTMLDKAGKDYAGLDPDPALTKAWDKMVRRLARDTFSISAWLWSRKARGKPPFPTTPKD